MGQERRRRERYRANLFATLTRPDTDEKIGRGVVVDVSVAGFGIETEAPLPIDEDLMCYVEVPLELRARVVRVITDGQRRRYGLQFKGQSCLENFVLKRLLKGPLKTRKVE